MTIGLLAGLHPGPLWLTPLLTVLLVAAMYGVDHPGVGARTLRQTITLDRAYADPVQLRAALEQLLGGDVKHAVVAELDMVRDRTVVDVRSRPAPVPLLPAGAAGSAAPPAATSPRSPSHRPGQRVTAVDERRAAPVHPVALPSDSSAHPLVVGPPPTSRRSTCAG